MRFLSLKISILACCVVLISSGSVCSQIRVEISNKRGFLLKINDEYVPSPLTLKNIKEFLEEPTRIVK